MRETEISREGWRERERERERFFKGENVSKKLSGPKRDF
jgi:hypothetical protein